MVEPATILSALLLVTAVAIALKLLKTVFETVTVAGISAVFYILMATAMNFKIDSSSVLTFAALGTAIYVGLSVSVPLIRFVWDIISFPFNVLNRIRSKMKDFRESKRLSKINEKLKKHEDKINKEASERDVKEVVLDRVKEKDSSSRD